MNLQPGIGIGAIGCEVITRERQQAFSTIEQVTKLGLTVIDRYYLFLDRWFNRSTMIAARVATGGQGRNNGQRS